MTVIMEHSKASLDLAALKYDLFYPLNVKLYYITIDSKA
jgi:hypothetical protein